MQHKIQTTKLPCGVQVRCRKCKRGALLPGAQFLRQFLEVYMEPYPCSSNGIADTVSQIQERLKSLTWAELSDDERLTAKLIFLSCGGNSDQHLSRNIIRHFLEAALNASESA